MKKLNDINKESKNKKKRILTACLGQCVHVAGTYNFINIAHQLDYDCIFLGPATPIPHIINNIIRKKPDIVGLSYRLTPTTVIPLLEEFFKKYNELSYKPKHLFFAGTPDVVKFARKFDSIDEFFIGGESKYKIISLLRRDKISKHKKAQIPMDIISRINWKKPYPIIRAHFGLPNLEETIKGIRQLAESEILDVISIAPDQNTQSNYFHPKNQIKSLSGAGGVPLRFKEDFNKLHKARLRGNSPLLRIYAGTRDFIKLGKLYQKTIKNAWAAISIFWFNQMDSRGPLTLKNSIKQHLEAIKWHAENNIPVEINDPHHWSLRDAPDAVAVADMYLCGIIAKKLGVKHFIAQFMFNTPPASSFNMDLAKIYAKNELLQTLVDDSFKVITQVRTGLASFPLNLEKAKGQLAASTLIQLSIKPDIVHVVSHSEAIHAACPEDIIESCNIVDQVINKVYSSNLKIDDRRIEERKEELIKQAKWIVNLIPRLAKNSAELINPWTNHKILNRLVKYGIFDAPHLKNNKFALGQIKTKIVDGACYSWDESTQKVIDEIERIKIIIACNSDEFLSEKELQGEFSPNGVMIQ
ncbi:MAG: methionine synthase [Promethearchaeota archaeon]|nr:MAG: methionine synthase [Candidatus Lokiarchaeota archaeon]